MNVDNIKYIFGLFRNLLASLSCELPRPARYQSREFLSARASCGQWIFLAVKFAIVNKQLKQRAARVLGRKAAKRASGQSTFFESKPSNC